MQQVTREILDITQRHDDVLQNQLWIVNQIAQVSSSREGLESNFVLQCYPNLIFLCLLSLTIGVTDENIARIANEMVAELAPVQHMKKRRMGKFGEPPDFSLELVDVLWCDFTLSDYSARLVIKSGPRIQHRQPPTTPSSTHHREFLHELLGYFDGLYTAHTGYNRRGLEQILVPLAELHFVSPEELDHIRAHVIAFVRSENIDFESITQVASEVQIRILDSLGRVIDVLAEQSRYIDEVIADANAVAELRTVIIQIAQQYL